MTRRWGLLASSLAATAVAFTACSTESAATSEGSLSGSITVSAAASLAPAFEQIGAGFEDQHPGVELTFNFDSSSVLATQILDGAPADVFASADEVNMARLVGEGEISGEPQTFALNELVIVTKPGNPTRIRGVEDLGDVGIVALCAAEAPCGRYAGRSLEAAGTSIPESSVTRAQNVTATLSAVSEGDAVAGIVYASEASRAGDAVEAVPIPAEWNVLATYPIAVLGSHDDQGLAEAFVAHVLSAPGQEVLARSGFLLVR